MMKRLLIILTLTGCTIDINSPESNYAKLGTYRDRYDFLNYNYIEFGKSIPVSKNGTINASAGLINAGSNNIIQPNKEINNFWEINYEYRW